MQAHGSGEPSQWVRRWTPLIKPGGRALDLACGAGRHARWLLSQGHPVTALDRDANALQSLSDIACCVQADIENQPWPLTTAAGVPETFDAVVVTNYLWRPLKEQILASVVRGGVLIYETFAHGQASVGRPARPEFLLQPGELLSWLGPDFQVVAFEDGFLAAPDRFVQRIAAIRIPADPDPPAAPARYPLLTGG